MKKYTVADFLKGYSKGKGHPPEFWLTEYVVNKLPNHIKYIIDFGSANGRNFIPFPSDKYKYVGFDIHDKQEISWMNDIDVEYHECSLEDFIKNYDGFSIDWKNSLVMSHISLMYLDDAYQQNHFISLLKSLGCKNFVFHEYETNELILNGELSEHARNGKLGWFDINEENLKMFQPPNGNKYYFRDFENKMCAFINLENE